MDEQTTAFLKNYGLIILLAVAGIAFFGFGILQLQQPDTPVIVADDQDSTESGEIVIDVGGAVLEPGVYSLPASSRIADALTRAGGITDEADTVYISKTINRAQPLQDGQKVYIPRKSEVVSSTQLKPEQTSGLININTASSSELDTLPGVGPVTSEKIITNRPYTKVEDLVDKKVVSESVFEKLREQITVY